MKLACRNTDTLHSRSLIGDHPCLQFFALWNLRPFLAFSTHVGLRSVALNGVEKFGLGDRFLLSVHVLAPVRQGARQHIRVRHTISSDPQEKNTPIMKNFLKFQNCPPFFIKLTLRVKGQLTAGRVHTECVTRCVTHLTSPQRRRDVK